MLVLEVLVVDPGVQHVQGDVVGAFAVYGVAVEFQSELLVGQVQFGCPDTVGHLTRLDGLAFVAEAHLEIVHVGLAYAIGPPVLRVLDFYI